MQPTSTWVPPVLRTDRLVIRPFTALDFPSVRAYVQGHPAAVYGSWLGGSGPDHVDRAERQREIVAVLERDARPRLHERERLGVEQLERVVAVERQVWHCGRNHRAV